MGYRKPEKRGLGHHRQVAPHTSIHEMRRNGWTVIARCPSCWLDCWVSLSTMERLAGRDLKLWDRTTPCRRHLCTGRMFFMATPPGEMRGAFMPLKSD